MDLQFSVGEDPSIDAHRSRRPVLEPDLPAAARWPAFAPQAIAAGAAAVFALPLSRSARPASGPSPPIPRSGRTTGPECPRGRRGHRRAGLRDHPVLASPGSPGSLAQVVDSLAAQRTVVHLSMASTGGSPHRVSIVGPDPGYTEHCPRKTPGAQEQRRWLHRAVLAARYLVALEPAMSRAWKASRSLENVCRLTPKLRQASDTVISPWAQARSITQPTWRRSSASKSSGWGAERLGGYGRGPVMEGSLRPQRPPFLFAGRVRDGNHLASYVTPYASLTSPPPSA